MLANTLSFPTKGLKSKSNIKSEKMQQNPSLRIGSWQLIAPQEILFFEADVNYTIIHFTNGKKMMVATTIKAFEERFKPFNFYRVHKTYLVNMACIKNYFAHENTIQLTDNKQISVSRRRTVDFRIKLHNKN